MTDIISSPLSLNDKFDYRSTKGANQGELNEKIGRKGDVIKILVKTLFCDFCHPNFQTLLEILPPPLLDPVQRRLEEDELSPDLITILSLLSFYCQLPEAAA